MTESLARIPSVSLDDPLAPSETALSEFSAHELIFAVVGPVGSGTSEIAKNLSDVLTQSGFDSTILKARHIIEAETPAPELPTESEDNFEIAQALQDAGDEMRNVNGDNAIIAVSFIERIRAKRAEKLGFPSLPEGPIEPDGTSRAYILDSIRHPDEVQLIRRVYQEAFCLIGVFCEEGVRLARLTRKYSSAGRDPIAAFMKRDQNAPEDHGQKVAAAFHLSDYFVDNTINRMQVRSGHEEANPGWDVPEQLARLVNILTHEKIVRPRPEETGMFHAYGARMQSSCLSRQVGAALMDQSGTLIATGTNEVPRAGGGVYGGAFSDGRGDVNDFRCFVHNRYCTNTRERNQIVDELLEVVTRSVSVDEKTTHSLRGAITDSRVGQLLEFSRSVHAEMDALLAAGRKGVSTVGARLFVTTFPCHSCARHIVAAGVEQVQYIEPYLKSQAIPLHGDAIVTDQEEWKSPAQAQERTGAYNVLFRPFIGVAPRLYRRAFLERLALKDPQTGEMLDDFDRLKDQRTARTLKVGYPQLEAHFASMRDSA